jgi:hypothetical protein
MTSSTALNPKAAWPFPRDRKELEAALAEVLMELTAYHDREWRNPQEGLPAHKAGEYPGECGGCAAISKARTP